MDVLAKTCVQSTSYCFNAKLCLIVLVSVPEGLIRHDEGLKEENQILFELHSVSDQNACTFLDKMWARCHSLHSVD